MIRKFSYITDLGEIVSINNAHKETREHETALESTEIGNLIHFSRSYAITNHNISSAIENGYFSEPNLVRQLQLHFAHIYFENLNSYAANLRMPRRWLKAGAQRRFGFLSSEISLLLAVRAHILCDAPLALRRLNTEPSVFASDYFRIQKVLVSSSREIITTLNPGNSDLEMRFKKTLVVPASAAIFIWRLKAWYDYTKAQGLYFCIKGFTAQRQST